MAFRAAAWLPCTLLCLAACGDPDAPRLGVDREPVKSGCVPSTCYFDLDHDGHGAGPAISSCDCGTPGYAAKGDDCDDGNPDAWRLLSCYHDVDGDGLGAGAATKVCAGASCTQGVARMADAAGDCDDGNAQAWQQLSCYPDADGDHFGTGTATQVCAGLTCADGVANRADSAGDCDDGRADVHPFGHDRPLDGVDQDCDGLVDESHLQLWATSGGVAGLLDLGNAAERDPSAAGELELAVYHRPLAAHSGPFTALPLQQAVGMGPTPVVIPTIALEAGEAHEVRVDLYRRVVLGGPGLPVQLHLRIPPPGGCTGDSTSTPPCSNAGPAYVAAGALATSAALEQARTEVVTRALENVASYQRAARGSWNTSLQELLDLPARDTPFSSEFYASAGGSVLKDLNACRYVSAEATPFCPSAWTSSAESGTPGLEAWFSAYPGAWSLFDDPDFTTLEPGDWLGVDPSAAHPEGTRTQVFLAYDAAAGRYWYAAGDVTLQTAWGPVHHALTVDSRDRCGGGYNLPPSASVCNGRGFYIGSVGRVRDAHMLP